MRHKHLEPIRFAKDKWNPIILSWPKLDLRFVYCSVWTRVCPFSLFRTLFLFWTTLEFHGGWPALDSRTLFSSLPYLSRTLFSGAACMRDVIFNKKPQASFTARNCEARAQPTSRACAAEPYWGACTANFARVRCGKHLRKTFIRRSLLGRGSVRAPDVEFVKFLKGLRSS